MSCGYHGGTINADICIPLNVDTNGSFEPRQRTAGGEKLYLEVTMDKAMSIGAVTAYPAIAGVTATADGTNVMLIQFPGDLPLDDTCYSFDLAGSLATDGGVEEAGKDFCVCYLEGDVNLSGVVEALDNSAVGANFFQNADNATRVRCDINRSGVVEALDNSAIGANFFQQPTPCP